MGGLGQECAMITEREAWCKLPNKRGANYAAEQEGWGGRGERYIPRVLALGRMGLQAVGAGRRDQGCRGVHYAQVHAERGLHVGGMQRMKGMHYMCPEKLVVMTVSVHKKGPVCTGWFLCQECSCAGARTSGLGPAEGRFSPGSHRTFRSYRPASLRWPVISDLPVTDIHQSILLGAKFLRTVPRNWEPLPLK